jgi:hypothetical protein
MNDETVAENQEWPERIAKIAPGQLSAANCVAQLAVQLCKLKNQAEIDRFEVEKKRYFNERSKLSSYPEKQHDLDKDWGKRTEDHHRLLTPAGYLPEAFNLLEKAREIATRPKTGGEYLAEHRGNKEALEKLLGNTIRQNWIPFEKLCDPERNRGATEDIHGISWKVYRGNDALRQFEKLFYPYWKQQVGDKADTLEKEPSVLARWKQSGVPPVDFHKLAEFRKNRGRVRLQNLKGNKKHSHRIRRPQGSSRRPHRK